MDGGVDRELEVLCRSCGLCCDGSLFGLVGLRTEELAVATKNRLRVLPRGNGFEQPCPALRTHDDGHACAVYAERPQACCTFTCRLYERHRREGGPLEVRLDAVRRVRALLRAVETASSTDADARQAVVAELSQRMEDDFARG